VNKLQSLTVKIRFFPNNPTLLKQLSQEYINLINQLTQQAVNENHFPAISTKDINTILPSAICNQAIRDAKSVYNKYKKTKKLSILKKPVYYINNQNYTILDNAIAFPISINGKTKKTYFKAIPTEKDMELIKKSKLGLMRIVEKSGKWYAQVSIKIPEQEEVNSENIMGIDLGLKVPAVAVTSTGKTKFFGNGRQIKYIRRKYQSRRKKLGKLKKLSAIKKLGDKESRWMKDQNHKISRQIINFAIKENVSVIKLETLANIRKTTRTSRKNARNLHNWSFYQLQQLIKYKANMVGIKVIEVNPAYTSQTCPNCGTKNKANDRKYECLCGFKTHRDRVGAINIMRQPVTDGNSLPA